MEMKGDLQKGDLKCVDSKHILQQAAQQHKDTTASAQRALRAMEQASDLAASTAAALRDQGYQMERITAGMDKVRVGGGTARPPRTRALCMLNPVDGAAGIRGNLSTSGRQAARHAVAPPRQQKKLAAMAGGPLLCCPPPLALRRRASGIHVAKHNMQPDRSALTSPTPSAPSPSCGAHAAPPSAARASRSRSGARTTSTGGAGGGARAPTGAGLRG
jgi:hypothetical protein